jgi:hypothetical protein
VPTYNAEGVSEFQPRVGACDNPGTSKAMVSNAESVRENRTYFANAFSVDIFMALLPRVEATLLL